MSLSAHRLGSSAMAGLLALALVLGLVTVTAPAATAADAPATSTAVTLNATVDPAGFAHPGIGVTAASLQLTQAKVAQGVEPWKSYYAAMAMTSYASPTLTSANQGAGEGVPASDAFNSQGMNARFIPDSLGAYTQALMYYFTGDPAYRANALKIVRIWSHLDPAKLTPFTDAHIHTGVPLYRMIAAAELLRATSTPDSVGGYPLAWTDRDTTDLTNNLIVPATETWLHDNTHYMNQHSFPLIGAIAGYIFTDNRARYDEAVEWTTMNATAPDPAINGALGAIFREVTADNPLNTFGKTFIQHQEMGRDQAHAGGDVHVLTTLARMIDVQGSKVDPATGTVSTARKAVTVYRFLNNRLLKGADAYAAFMMGQDTPWVDLSGGSAHISQWYRGRWSDTLNELYHIYTYQQGQNVARIAPAIQQQFDQRDGALFYNGNSAEIGTVVGDNGLRSFWGGTDPGAEYWLSLPEQASGESVPVPTDSSLQLEAKGVSLDNRSWSVTEGDRTFLRAKAARNGTTIAMRSMSYGARTSYSPVGVMVRTSAVATLAVSKRAGDAPYQQVTIPNTGGQWRYVTYDMDTHVVPLPAMGDNNIAFYTISGTGENVDVDFVNLLAPTQLTPPRFAVGAQSTLIGVRGVALTATFLATDDGGEALQYGLEKAPRGASLDSTNGSLTWIPNKNQVGDTTFYVQTSDGTTSSAVAVTTRVAGDRQGAYQLAREGFDSNTVYTGASLAVFQQADAAAQAAVGAGSDSDFASALIALQTAVKQLALLNPTYADGTLAYAPIVTSTLGTEKLGFLVDDDSSTFSGDLSSTSFTLDFGEAFRVKASAFEVQARLGFGNRSQGSNVYGSNDQIVWTKLTTAMTTNTDARETLPVAADLTDTAFRFIKVQVDQPGVPTDPNFPGIFSVAELRVHGQRLQAVTSVATATISSTNALPGRAVNGDTVTLSFTTREPISAVTAQIEGAAATVDGSGTNWTVSTRLPDTVAFGRNLGFRVDYHTANGAAADPLVVTTDGSTLYLSNQTRMITELGSKITVVGPTGEIDTSKTDHIAKTLDGQTTTFSDIGPVDGKYYAILDFAEGGAITLDRAELLARQDNNGLTRTNAVYFEGSNDLSTWKRLTPNAQGTLGWQNLNDTETTSAPYRYLRISSTTWINLAELRLFGTYTAPPASYVATAGITSNNTLRNLAIPGDTVTVSLTGTRPLANLIATIDGAAATVSGSGTTWTATTTVPAGATPGRKLGFRIEYTAADGTPGRAVTATTDGSSVYLSTTANLIPDVLGKATVVDLTGAPDPTKAPHVAKMFDQQTGTFSDFGAVNGQYFTVLDFGEGGSVALSAAELLVRQNADGLRRASGLFLQGSNDLTTWDRITANATGTLSWQPLSPWSSSSPVAYRYLRISGSDWINIAELRFFGTYTAPPASLIRTATLTSSNAQAGLAVPGDTVTLALTATEPLATVTGTIAGLPAVVNGSGTAWTAAVTVPAGATLGSTLPLRIGYTSVSGTPGRALITTTDGSAVFVSGSDGLITDLPTKSTLVSLTGTAEPTKQAQVAKMFDQQLTTFSDIGPVGGQYYVVFDLGSGGSLALTRAELRVRQDSFGTSRSGSLHLEGSNDLSSWTTLTKNATGTLGWQTLSRPDPSAQPTGFRYLRVANNNWINVAELRLFGTYATG